MVLKSHLDLKLKRPSEWPLYSHHISIQQNTSEMWWNGTFRKKSLRNVSSTVVNLCHKESRPL